MEGDLLQRGFGGQRVFENVEETAGQICRCWGKKVLSFSFFLSLSWLGVHIKHRATSSNYDKVNMKFLVFEQPLCVRASTLAV